MSAAVTAGMHVNQYDIGNAFLEANIDCIIIMRFPPGLRTKDANGDEHVLILLKALYGTKQAPSMFNKRYCAFMESVSLPFTQSSNDPTLFVCRVGKHLMYVINWVDDIVVCTTSNSLKAEFDNLLRNEFKKITGGEQIQWFLKAEFKYDKKRKAMSISQNQLIMKAVLAMDINTDIIDASTERLNVGTEKCKLRPCANSDLLNKDDATQYRSCVGILMWIFCLTRPDIGFTLIQCSRFVSRPGVQHMHELKKLCKYMYQTRNDTLNYNHNVGNTPVHDKIGAKPHVITGASDCGYASNYDLTSTGAYQIFDGGNPVSWKVYILKQHLWSVFAGELSVHSELARETTFCKRVAADLHHKQQEPSVLYCDFSQTCLH
jgi:hypothetical protein